MKHLLLSLTLLVSGSLWAEDNIGSFLMDWFAWSLIACPTIIGIYFVLRSGEEKSKSDEEHIKKLEEELDSLKREEKEILDKEQLELEKRRIKRAYEASRNWRNEEIIITSKLLGWRFFGYLFLSSLFLGYLFVVLQ